MWRSAVQVCLGLRIDRKVNVIQVKCLGLHIGKMTDIMLLSIMGD